MAISKDIASAYELGQTELSFGLGDQPVPGAWKLAQVRSRLWLPRAWVQFVSTVGAGRVFVRSREGDDRSEWLTPDNREDKLRRGRVVEFDVRLSGPERPIEPIGDDYVEERPGTVWCIVGNAWDGDCLAVRARRWWLPPAREGEVAWWNHEGAGLVYRWASVGAFVAGMLDLARTGEPQRVEDQRKEAAQRRWRIKNFDEPKRLHADVPPLPARVRGELRWVTCPHCGHTFMSGTELWDGEAHAGCGKRIILVEEE